LNSAFDTPPSAAASRTRSPAAPVTGAAVRWRVGVRPPLASATAAEGQFATERRRQWPAPPDSGFGPAADGRPETGIQI